MAHRNNIPKTKNITNKESTSWVNTHTQNKTQYKNIISKRFQTKLRRVECLNNKLLSRINRMGTRSQYLQDIKIKYLSLKEKVLETEEQLLLNGIDTSGFSAFCNEKEDIIDSNNEIVDTIFEIDSSSDTEN